LRILRTYCRLARPGCFPAVTMSVPSCSTSCRPPAVQPARRHVVFTLPPPLGEIAFQNKAAVYAILLRAAADTLAIIAVHLASAGGARQPDRGRQWGRGRAGF